MIKWEDIHSSLQVSLITSAIPTKTSEGQIRREDLDDNLIYNIRQLNFPSQTSNGRLRWTDLSSDLQDWIYSEMVPIGYGAGTTGGASLTTTKYTVTNLSQWNAAKTGNASKIIIVDGEIAIGNFSTVGSNTTITSTPGSVIDGNIRLNSVTNVIIKNLNVTNYNADAVDCIGVSASTKVWLTRLYIYNWGDGGADFRDGADMCTVDYCKMWQDDLWSHALANLMGADDANPLDPGKLHITFHHNWWWKNITDRMPRVRFGGATYNGSNIGPVHCFNNLYDAFPAGAVIPKVSAYITAAIGPAEVLSENNYFENGEDCFLSYQTTGGIIEDRGSYIDPAVGGTHNTSTGTVTNEPPYSYVLETPEEARTNCHNYARAWDGFV